MEDNLNVTVLIPAFNCAGFLERAVDSALVQKGITNLQIVVVDDASTDGTFQVMESLAERYPVVEIFKNQTNRGPGVSRNLALSKAKGEWLAVLDADDAMHPERISRLIEKAQEENAKIIADLPIFFDFSAQQEEPRQLVASGNVESLSFEDFLKPDLETGLDFGLLKPIIHRSLVENGVWRYPEVRHGEDFWVNMSALMSGAKFILLREPHYIFSTRIGAISEKYSPASMTAVNYLSVAEQSAQLGGRLRSVGMLTPELEYALYQREHNAILQNRKYGWTTLRKGEFRRHFKWLLQDPRNRRTILSIIAQKLAGHRGIPD